MKRSSNLNSSWSTALAGVRTAVLAVVMALAASGIAQAQTDGTWTDATGGDWSDTANWLNGNVASGDGATAYFNTLDITANPTVMVNADATFGTLNVGDTTAPIKGYAFKTPTTGGPYTWTLDNGVSSPVINVTTGGASLVKPTSGGTFNITNGMDLIKDGQGTLSFDAITFTSPSGGLNIKQGEVVTYSTFLPQGAITMGDGTTEVTLAGRADKAGGGVNLGARAITLNAGTQTLRASPTGNGDISGDGALSIQPPAGFSGRAWGSYFGSPESTYSGGTTIGGNGSDKVILAVAASSTLVDGVVTKGPLGTGTVTLDGGGLAPFNAQTLHNAIVIQKDADLQDHGSPATTRNLTLAGPVTLSGGSRALTITIARTDGSGNVTINGAIGDDGNGYGLTVRSGGLTPANDVLVLTGNNTFSGDTRVVDGALRLGAASGTTTLALQNSTLNLQAGDAGSVAFGAAADTTIINATIGGLKGARDLALQNMNTTPAAVALTVGGNGQSTTYSGALTGSGSLTKVGSGTLQMSGVNTYSGTTVITAGALRFNGQKTGAGTITVDDNGLIGGIGTIAGNTTVAGRLSPGNSPGNITFANDLTLSGVYDWEYGDQTTVQNVLTLQDTWVLNVLAGYGLQDRNDVDGISVALFTYGTVSFEAPASVTGFGGYSVADVRDDGAGTIWLDNVGWAAIPEPGSMVLISLGALLLWIRRHRSTLLS
jgi:autotransporter-associated beta strand protein